MIVSAVLAVTQSCFLLYQVGVGEVRRNPSTSCRVCVSPQSTFKIPHALAALDAKVIDEATLVKYAAGEHPFAQPWPADAVVSAKTGAGPTGDRRAVRWLVGHVRRGSREWLFVSNVISDDDLPPLVAVEQAERALIDARVLR